MFQNDEVISASEFKMSNIVLLDITNIKYEITK